KLAAPIGIANVSVHGGLYIITGSAFCQPSRRCSWSIAERSYGLRPAAFNRPAAQYSSKSSSGHGMGAAERPIATAISSAPSRTDNRRVRQTLVQSSNIDGISDLLRA